MKRISSIALAAVALAASATQSRAQLPGIPYGPVETGTGISVAADYGRPGGGASAYGLTGGIGFSSFGLSASAGAFKQGSLAGVKAQTAIGGRLGMKLFGGGLLPVTIGAQVGFGSSKTYTSPTTTVTSTAILPAAFVKLSVPLFPLKPWGVVYYQTGTNVAKEVRFTLGANFNLLLGLGVHAGYDTGKSGHGWGVGAHFNFHVPGLGVPGVPGM